jgi:HEAT repeat protein
LWALIPLGLIATGAAAAERSPPGETGKPAKPSAAALKLLEYREPVNGLVARIEGIRWSYPHSEYVALRLENRGKTPVEVPSPYPADDKEPCPYSLWGRDFGKWKLVPWEKEWRKEHDRPWSVGPKSGNVVLQPGDSVLFLLGGHLEGGFGDERPLDDMAELAIVVYREKAATKYGWTGKLQTPPYPIHTGEKLWHELREPLPLPTYFPQFSPKRKEFLSGPNDGTVPFTELRNSNCALVRQLGRYPAPDVARFLAKRVAEEKNVDLRNFLTVYLYAAAVGDFEDEPFITRGGIFARERQQVLAALDRQRQRDGPDWQPTRKWVTDTLLDAFQSSPTSAELASALGELRCKEAVPLLVKMLRIPERCNCAAAALEKIGDPRAVPALLEILPAAAAADERRSTVYLSTHSAVLDALVELKATEAVPAIIELAKKSNGHPGYLLALQRLGDSRTIPPLLEMLQAYKKTPGADDKDQYHFDRLVETLAALRAKQAVPVLLKHLGRESCVEALGELGDPQAIPALQKVAAGKGTIAVAAKLAIAKLGEGDPTPRYVALLADKTLSDNEKRIVAERLEETKSPLAIPHLVAVIRNDPNRYATFGSIQGLGQIKDLAAAEALIRSFDFDYTGKSKEEHEMRPAARPSDYPAAIAKSLRQLTGANIGTNPAHWRKWWNEEGKKGEWLK